MEFSAAVPVDDHSLRAVYSKVSRRVVPILLIGYIVAYLDRVNVGFAKLRMLVDLQFSETVYGLGAGIFFLGYFFFEVPSNYFLHRVGARIWIARIMITWGVLSALTLLIKTPTEFFILRFLLGAAEAGFFPGVILYITQWYPARLRGRITALFMTGIAICSALGSLVSGWIMSALDGVAALHGWQWLFLLEAIPALAMGIVIFRFLVDKASDASWLTANEKASLLADLRTDEGQKVPKAFSAAFGDPRVWLACLTYFCAMTGLYGISFWLPTIISEMGVKIPWQIGLISAIPYTIAGIGMVLVGRSADSRNERRWHTAVPAVLGAVGLAMSVVFANHHAVALAALTLAAFGILTAPPLFWTISTTFLSGAAAAAGIAIINSFGNLAGFASPYLVGYLKDSTGSTAIGMYLIAAFELACGVLVLLSTRSSHYTGQRPL